MRRLVAQTNGLRPSVPCPLLLVLAVAPAGCGGEEAPPASPAAPPAVAGELNLERAQPGGPDAGTQAGHRGGGARATTRTASLAFTGSVRPATARVTVRGAQASVRHGEGGRFRVTVRGLERGETELDVRATAAGHAPWTDAVTVRRR